MPKKIVITCAAVGVLASLLLASATSAAPVITHPTGTVLAAGSKIKATNVGEAVFTSSILNVFCNSNSVTGELTKNETTNGFAGELTSAGFNGSGIAGDCTGSGSFFSGAVRVTPETGTNGLPWCVTGFIDSFEINGGSCAFLTRNIRFALDLTGLVTCTYERISRIPGTFTTHPNDMVLSSSEVEFTRVSGFGCASVVKLDMSFTLETDTLSAEPLYVSS